MTKASESEVVNARGMIDDIGKDNPEILERCEYFTADRGYDDTKLITKLEGLGISPVIDIRNCWQATPETTRPLESDMRVTHTFDGKVFCSCGPDGEEKRMVCRGYEVGFYSAFMAASKIDVYTRKTGGDGKFWHWTSDGTNSYDVDELPADSAPARRTTRAGSSSTSSASSSPTTTASCSLPTSASCAA